MSGRAFAAFMTVLAVIALMGFGLIAKDPAALAVGESLPEVELVELGEPESRASIADYRGSWVLVNVWASWCDPCREEAPDLEEFWTEHRDDGLVVLGLNSRDNTPDAEAFVEEFSLTYPQLRDPDGSAPDELAMTGFPESFLIDPQGRLALKRPGPVDMAYMREHVEPVIAAEEEVPG